MNIPVICFYRKDVYGNEVFYVKDEEQRRWISQLTGCKTLRESDIQSFEHLGLSFIEVPRN